MPHGSRRRPALWLLSGLGFVAFFLLLGAGSANAETDPAEPGTGLLQTVGAGVTGAVTEQVAPVTDAVGQDVVEPVRHEVVEPVTEPVRETIDPVIKPVRETVVKPLRDRVVEPVTQPVHEAVEPVTKPVRETVRETVAPIVEPVHDDVVEPVVPVEPAEPAEPAAPVEVDAVPAPGPVAPVSPAPSSVEVADGSATAETPRVASPDAIDLHVDLSSAPATSDASSGSDDRQPAPVQPLGESPAVLTTSSSSSHASSHGDGSAGAAAGTLSDSRADWYRATWSIRVIARDHVLPRSVTHRPGFSPD